MARRRVQGRGGGVEKRPLCYGAPARALQYVGAERMLLERGPVEAGPRYTRRVDAPKPKQLDDEGDEAAPAPRRDAPGRSGAPRKPAQAPVAVVSPRVVEPVRKRGFLERQRDKKQLTLAEA